MPPALRDAAAGVFDRRSQLNAAYMREGRGERFYDFVAAQLSGGISPSPRR